MPVAKLSRTAFLLALSVPLAWSVSACGNKNEVKHAQVKAGAMPDGGEWQGVYYSPLYGYLHIVADGESVNGAWRTAAGDAYGELAGKTDGNLLSYEWKERRIGAVGADAVKTGKGYFVYMVPKEGEAHEIRGEWGLGENEAGNKWEALKQTNMPPDLSSVKPDEYEGQVKGGGWDSGGSEEGASEGDSESAPSDSGSEGSDTTDTESR